ncbi:DNA repair exonuclease [Candidatus Woesearchaeota archaeon]|nr:DNA repair exonuclease [Candidatus Woesearchaeota archaeon]
MRFTHTADCHIGGHRNPKLRILTEDAFSTMVSESIEAKVDFVLISGDLFNTAIPGIDALKFTVTQLSRLKKEGIRVYAIPGSHDFSPSGKTMLDVLERAGLLVNVWRGEVKEGKLRLELTEDSTGVKLTGILGRRGQLDKEHYEDLDQSIGKEPGDKIFLFHTTLDELKPPRMADIPSQPVSFLPEGFMYYAGGHVHIVERYNKGPYNNIVYPGPLFPNSFSELEELGHGGYFLYEDGELTRKDIKMKDTVSIPFSVEGLSGPEAREKLTEQISKEEIADKIILLRFSGRITEGSITDLDIPGVVKQLEQKAYCVLRNTSKLSTSEFVQQDPHIEDAEHMENALLAEHASELKIDGREGVELAKSLLKLLSREPEEGEKQYEYKESIITEALELIDK